MSTPEAAAPTPLDAQLCFSLYTASRALTGAYRDLLAGTDITYPQYLVLLTLFHEDGLTVSELGNRLRLDSGTLSPLLRRLEQAGHLRRVRSTDDGRVVTLHLTDDGSLGPLFAKVQHCLVETVGLDSSEIIQLRTLSNRLTTALSQHDRPPAGNDR